MNADISNDNRRAASTTDDPNDDDPSDDDDERDSSTATTTTTPTGPTNRWARHVPKWPSRRLTSARAYSINTG
jgi:hypothetical protein